MKFDIEECSRIKINHSRFIVLKYLIEHFNFELSPLNISSMKKEIHLSHSSIYNSLRFLSDNNIIEKTFNRSELRLYIRLIPSKYIIEKDEVNEMLIEPDEEIEICKEADLIARLILKRYPQFFSHKTTRGGKVTNLYKDICRRICDIYNGSFLNSRLYNLNYDFNWKKILKDVRGDWLKVRRLILANLKNFDLMHKKEYLPFNKKILKSNLKEWFYDDNQFRNGNPTSQFIESINPPEFADKYISEKKADEIFNELPGKVQDGGNNLFSLNENMASGKFWEYIREMFEWAKMAWRCDDNMTSWLESPSDIVEQFYQYCKENDISVSLNTCNIRKAVESNAPWVWFVQSACEEYGINKKIANCIDSDDFEKYFSLR